MTALTDPEVLRKVNYRLSYKLDGTPAAGETVRRRRRVLNTAIEYAMERELLTKNPLSAVNRAAATSGRVDARVLLNKVQAAQMFTAVSYIGARDRKKGRRLVAFYAVM